MSTATTTKSVSSAAPKAAATTTRKAVTAHKANTAKTVAKPAATPAAALPKAELDAILATAANQPSQLHKNMVAWLAAAGQEVDLRTVQLVCSLRMDFQASEMNQNDLKARKAAAAQKQLDRVAKAQERADKAVAAAKKLAAAAAKK
jgi:hypothetical protein